MLTADSGLSMVVGLVPSNEDGSRVGTIVSSMLSITVMGTGISGKITPPHPLCRTISSLLQINSVLNKIYQSGKFGRVLPGLSKVETLKSISKPKVNPTEIAVVFSFCTQIG